MRMQNGGVDHEVVLFWLLNIGSESLPAYFGRVWTSDVLFVNGTVRGSGVVVSEALCQNNAA